MLTYLSTSKFCQDSQPRSDSRRVQSFNACQNRALYFGNIRGSVYALSALEHYEYIVSFMYPCMRPLLYSSEGNTSVLLFCGNMGWSIPRWHLLSVQNAYHQWTLYKKDFFDWVVFILSPSLNPRVRSGSEKTFLSRLKSGCLWCRGCFRFPI